TFKTLCLLNYALMIRHDYDITSSLRRGALQKEFGLAYIREKEGHSDCDLDVKGTKREVFGMPIPGSLITSDIQEASYYQEYLAKVAKHRRYLAGETGSDPNSPAPKPTKAARKPWSTTPKAPPRPSVLEPITSTQPESKSAPDKTQGKKRKPTTEMFGKPSKATKSRHGFVDAKEADMQRALEESLKSMYDVPRDPLPLVSPPHQQQSIVEAMMMKRIGELEHIMAILIQKNKGLEERLDSHGAHVVHGAMQALLRNHFRELPEADMKEILHQRMWETESYKSHKDHMQLYEALEKTMNRDHSKELAKDLAEAHRKKKKRPSGASGAPGASRSSQVPPPPPPPPFTNQETWTTTDIRFRPSILLTLAYLQMDEDMAPDEQAQSSDDEDIGSAHIPKASALASNYSPPLKDSLLAQTGPAFEIVKVFNPDVIHLQYQMEECHKLLTDSVDDSILRHNVSKPLPLGGPPEQMVPDQFWIEEECKYDIATSAVKTHMRILSVVRIEVFSMYGYDLLKKIVIRFEYKHDYTIIDSLRAVTFRDRYGVQMMMRFNEIHKFSDGTLQQIDEALDYRVKEFKINRMNPGLNTRFWTRKDVDRSKAFMFAIQKRLKTKRIFCNLESFLVDASEMETTDS
nr:hypothetical protein [Tanacetum cinerariifolium]